MVNRERVATLTAYEIFASGILGPWSDPLQLPGPACASVWGDPSSLSVIGVEDAGKRLRLEGPPITVSEFGAGPFALIR